MEKETTEKSLVEKREELMVSSSSSSSSSSTTITINLRMANFLNPTYSTISRSPILKNPKFISSSSPLICSTKTKQPVNVILRGWKNQSVEWGSWVQHLKPLYGSVWKRAGIYDAIISSTFKIHRDNDVIIGLAEKWCHETNTFVFPWGEATITLEDMMVLGGFSVFGSPVFSSSSQSKELKLIEHELETAKNYPCISQIGWINKFMCCGSDIEHEAFLSLWLERFVFNDSGNKFQPPIFSVAVHLAKGKVYALAPVVLASIYRDLGLLKTTIECKENEISAHNKLAISLCCPLQLVQLWAWERFPAFQQSPNVINDGDPRSALWINLKVQKLKCVRSYLDSAAENFIWQPYLHRLHGLHFHKLYKEKKQSSRDFLAYALCLRVSVLVGLDCIQQYLPHRVARQFRLDQDIPSNIARTDLLPDLAWSDYIRPFSVFIPSHLSKPDVTVRYLEWWNQTATDPPDTFEDPVFNPVRKKRCLMPRSKRVPQAWIGDPVESITQADAAIEPVRSITRADAAFIESIDSITQPDAAIKPVENITRADAAIVPPESLTGADAAIEPVYSISQADAAIGPVDSITQADSAINPVENITRAGAVIEPVQSIITQAVAVIEPVESITRADAAIVRVEGLTRSEAAVEPVDSITQADAAIGPVDSSITHTDAAINPVENITRAEAVIESVESTITLAVAVIEPVKGITRADAAIGSPLNELAAETDAGARIPTNTAGNRDEIRNGGENVDDYTTEIPGIALEARIAAIEKAVAKLKPAKGLKTT